MLYYAAMFFIVAVVAAIFGFGGIAAGAVEIAKILFFIFLILFIGSLDLGIDEQKSVGRRGNHDRIPHSRRRRPGVARDRKTS